MASTAVSVGNGTVQKDGTVTLSFSVKDLGDQVSISPDGKIQIPDGMSALEAARILVDLQKQMFEETEFSTMFDVRPYDGAVAIANCLREKFGMVFGRGTPTFFGTRPPEIVEVRTGPGANDTVQVPWGRLEIPNLKLPGSDVDTVVTVTYGHSAKFGIVSKVSVSCARGLKKVMEEFFAEVRTYLQNNSIYRGKAIRSVQEYAQIEFPQLRSLDPGSICYSTEARDLLRDQIHAFIQYSQAYRDAGMSLRRAALLHGPFGTGKSSFGWITAQIAVQHGWTFIFGTPEDSPERLLEMAQMYSPAVVFMEDIDVATSSGDARTVTRFLEAFDGVSAKTQEIIVIMTTNNISEIHEGMLRPGRLDAIVRIDMLDAGGIQRLIEASLGERMLPGGRIQENQLSDDIDWPAVTSAMQGFFPAYVKEATVRVRSLRIAFAAREGKELGLFTTEHLVSAAHAMREHLQLQQAAGRGYTPPDIDTAIRRVVAGAVETVVGNTSVDGEDLIVDRDALTREV